MLAKVMAWGKTRKEAIFTLDQALQHTILFGLQTNKGFLRAVLNHPRFAASPPTTRFLEEIGEAIAQPKTALLVAGVVCALYAGRAPTNANPWSTISGWTFAGSSRRERHRLSAQGRKIDIVTTYDGKAIHLDFDHARHIAEILSAEPQALRLLVDGDEIEAFFHRAGMQLFVDAAGHHLTLTEPDYSEISGEQNGEGSVRAPMPGRVLKLDVGPGDAVRSGDRLLLLEAMKMEHILRAPVTGRVATISIAEGQQVREGDELCIITPEAS
jgi:acetyl/propionyl-CoA carboxylase alpha subunit